MPDPANLDIPQPDPPGSYMDTPAGHDYHEANKSAVAEAMGSMAEATAAATGGIAEVAGKALHPATVEILRFFAWVHLPPHLAAVSRQFADLASSLAYDPHLDGPEVAVALRKLLEAKDAAVRARL